MRRQRPVTPYRAERHRSPRGAITGFDVYATERPGEVVGIVVCPDGSPDVRAWLQAIERCLLRETLRVVEGGVPHA